MSMSWRGPTSPLPAEINPRACSSGCSATATAPIRPPMARLEHQKSVLDYVDRQPVAVAHALGTGDKRSSRSTSSRSATSSAGFNWPSEQNVTTRAAASSSGRPRFRDDYVQYANAHDRLQVVAWQTDMTRVGSFMLGTRRQQPRLSRNRHFRRASLHLAPSG